MQIGMSSPSKSWNFLERSAKYIGANKHAQRMLFCGFIGTWFGEPEKGITQVLNRDNFAAVLKFFSGTNVPCV